MRIWELLFVHLFVFVHSDDSCKVADDQVTFYLHSRKNDVEIQLTDKNLNLVNSSQPTRFLIHGYTGSHYTGWFIQATDIYLSKGDYNVIQVDWAEPASHDFNTSANCTKPVGELVGKLISELVTNYSVSLETIHVIGHSFGSHVAGFTGKTVKTLTSSKVRQITALDPSRNPTFENSTASNRLHNEDAEIVVALHTDAGGHGFVEAIGLIDFYPNGGAAKQPACEESEEEGCSHGMAVDYFVESVNNTNGFVSTKCGSYKEYESGSCRNNKNITLGGNLTAKDEGIYYLDTNKQKPFSKE